LKGGEGFIGKKLYLKQVEENNPGNSDISFNLLKGGEGYIEGCSSVSVNLQDWLKTQFQGYSI
jgi:hypothetical protein